MNTPKKTSETASLRKKAIELHEKKQAKSKPPFSEADNLKIIHELEVHQIELELQNEELLLARTVAQEAASEKYTNLYDFAPSGYFTLSRKGDIVGLNLKGAQMLGKARSQLIGSAFGFFISSDTLPAFQLSLEKFFTENSPGSCEVTLVNNGNVPMHVFLSGKLDENKEHCLVSAVDITERKLAEEALRESKTRFEDLVELLPEAVFETDKDLKLTYVNQRAIELTGYSKDDLTKGMTGLDMLTPEDRTRARAYFRMRIKGESPGTLEYRAMKKDGSTYPILFHASPIFSEGKIFGVRGIIIDITRFKQTEEKIRQESARFHQLVDTINSGVAIYKVINDGESGRDYIIQDFNKAALKLEGLTKDEVVDRSLADIRPNINDYGLIRIFREVWKTGKPAFYPAKVYVDKKYSNYYENRVFRLPNGEVVAVYDDVTERETAAIKIKESKDRFDLAMKATKDGVYDWNLLTNEIYYSPSWKSMLGYREDELSNDLSAWETLTSPEGIKESWVLLNELINKERDRFEIEFKMKHKDGHWVNVLSRAEAIFDASGKAVRIVGTHVDISERKHADLVKTALFNISNRAIRTDDLKQLIWFIKEELGAIIDTTNFFIALYDEKTDTLSLPFFTDEKDNITSLPAGKTLTYYVIKTQKSLLATRKEKRKLEQAGEIELFGSDSEVWLGVPLKIEGRVMGVVVVQSYTDENAFNKSDQKMLEFVSDQVSISIDRKNAEVSLVLALEKARESDRLKSAFLAAMSHELRTPLNAIIGFSEIINEDETPLEEVLEFNKTILSSGNHLLKIVEAIFDIALFESGETKSTLEDVRLNIILNDVIEISKIEQERANKNNLALKLVNSLEEKDLLIKTDPAKLKQILISLLKNALKFTHSGEINFACRIDKSQDRQVILFLVEDTGIGVPKAKQDFIFDVFRQAEDSNTRKYGGVGLGLAIAKKLTLLLGGNIWLESEEGAGSKFYFTIPIEEEIKFNTIPILKEKKYSRLKGKTILVVEDIEYSFEFLQIVLEKPGVNTLWAKDGKEAIALCSENKDIDLVLMDINMPIMNGYDATREIRKTMPNLPIIAQTANAIAGDREKSLASGCNDYISKPVKKAELFVLLGKYL